MHGFGGEAGGGAGEVQKGISQKTRAVVFPRVGEDGVGLGAVGDDEQKGRGRVGGGILRRGCRSGERLAEPLLVGVEDLLCR